MTYRLEHLSAVEIRGVANLARAMFEEGPETVQIADIDLGQVLNSSPEEIALAEALGPLSRNKKIELMALAYLGRGDFSDVTPEAGVARLIDILERHTDEEISEKIMGKSPSLATYLDNALRTVEA